jgi:hypothetical protein
MDGVLIVLGIVGGLWLAGAVLIALHSHRARAPRHAARIRPRPAQRWPAAGSPR